MQMPSGVLWSHRRKKKCRLPNQEAAVLFLLIIPIPSGGGKGGYYENLRICPGRMRIDLPMWLILQSSSTLRPRLRAIE